jgi:hypothetical protein
VHDAVYDAKRLQRSEYEGPSLSVAKPASKPAGAGDPCGSLRKPVKRFSSNCCYWQLLACSAYGSRLSDRWQSASTRRRNRSAPPKHLSKASSKRLGGAGGNRTPVRHAFDGRLQRAVRGPSAHDHVVTAGDERAFSCWPKYAGIRTDLLLYRRMRAIRVGRFAGGTSAETHWLNQRSPKARRDSICRPACPAGQRASSGQPGICSRTFRQSSFQAICSRTEKAPATRAARETDWSSTSS